MFMSNVLTRLTIRISFSNAPILVSAVDVGHATGRPGSDRLRSKFVFYRPPEWSRIAVVVWSTRNHENSPVGYLGSIYESARIRWTQGPPGRLSIYGVCRKKPI